MQYLGNYYLLQGTKSLLEAQCDTLDIWPTCEILSTATVRGIKHLWTYVLPVRRLA